MAKWDFFLTDLEEEEEEKKQFKLQKQSNLGLENQLSLLAYTQKQANKKERKRKSPNWLEIQKRLNN